MTSYVYRSKLSKEAFFRRSITNQSMADAWCCRRGVAPFCFQRSSIEELYTLQYTTLHYNTEQCSTQNTDLRKNKRTTRRTNKQSRCLGTQLTQYPKKEMKFGRIWIRVACVGVAFLKKHTRTLQFNTANKRGNLSPAWP